MCLYLIKINVILNRLFDLLDNKYEGSKDMTCLDAQSHIIAYIEDGLDKDKKIEFLNHVKGCDNCKEELDIYYTMIEGMHRMDNNLPISVDFRSELSNRMDRELRQNRNRRGFFRYSFLVVLLGVLGFAIAGYINFLNIIHADEQQKLKNKQGEYYYSSTFDDVMFEPDSRTLNINIEPKVEEERSFYSKIREYNIYK